MTNQLKWKDGFRAKIDVQDAYDEIKRIGEIQGYEYNALPAETVKEEAREKSNPLHKQIFNKPLKEAAEQYYTEEARKVLRSIVICYEEAPLVEERAFQVVTVQKEDKPVRLYMETKDALSDPFYREQVLARFLREMANMRRRYAALSELSKIWQEVDKVAVNM